MYYIIVERLKFYFKINVFTHSIYNSVFLSADRGSPFRLYSSVLLFAGIEPLVSLTNTVFCSRSSRPKFLTEPRNLLSQLSLNPPPFISEFVSARPAGDII